MRKFIVIEICIVIALAVGFWLGRITTPYNDYSHYLENADKVWVKAQQLDSPPISFDEPDKNKLRKVRAAYREVFDNYPDSRWADDAIYEFASRLPRTDEEGFALFRRLIRDYPDSEYTDDAMYAIAITTYRIAEELGKTGTLESRTAYYDRALSLFNQLIATYPGSILQEEAQLSAAMCYYGRGDVNIAQNQLDNLKLELRSHPIIYRIMFTLGNIYLEQKDYENAQIEFRNVVDSGDTEHAPIANFRLAQAYFGEGQAIEIEAQLKEVEGKAEEAQSKYEDAEAKYKQAITGYQNVIDLFPDTQVGKDAHFYIGWALEKTKDYDEAISRLEFAIENYPDNENTINAKYYIGQLAYANDETDRAIEIFQAFADDPNHTYDHRLSAQYQIGEIYENMENMEKAAEAYQKLITDFPEPHQNVSHPSRRITENFVNKLRSESLDEN